MANRPLGNTLAGTAGVALGVLFAVQLVVAGALHEPASHTSERPVASCVACVFAAAGPSPSALPRPLAARPTATLTPRAPAAPPRAAATVRPLGSRAPPTLSS